MAMTSKEAVNIQKIFGEKMTEEEMIEYESNLIDAMNRYFSARVGRVERTISAEKLFSSGFRMASEICREKLSNIKDK